MTLQRRDTDIFIYNKYTILQIILTEATVPSISEKSNLFTGLQYLEVVLR